MIPFFTYTPDSLSEFVGQDKPLKLISSFFTHFKKGKGLFLYGPPGTGKTSSIHAFAKQEGYELLELNASDTRSSSQLKEFLSKATGQMSLFATKKIILLDEIDGLSGTKDRGAASVVASFIKSSIFPIVVTGVAVFDKKFAPIKKLSQVVEFSAVDPKSLTEILKHTCLRAKLQLDEKVLKIIARHAAGDVRAALNDLFTFALVKNSSLDDLEPRRQTEALANALIKVFKSKNPSIVIGAYDLIDEDLGKIFLWLDENLPSEYRGAKDLDNAYAILADADVFFGRIRRWQYYRFYVYCYLLLSLGIALSKGEKYSSQPKYKRPMRLLKYWQANMANAKRNLIVEKLADAVSVSKKRALRDIYPYLLPALAKNAALAKELELSTDELVWLNKQIKN